MNPSLGLAIILGVSGVCLIFARKVDVRLSSGELHEQSPKISVGGVFPLRVWKIIGFLLVGAAIALAAQALSSNRQRLEMWGNVQSINDTEIVCRIVGSTDGVPFVGFLLNAKAGYPADFDYRFVTSEWPRTIYVQGEEVRPLDTGMILFLNRHDGSIARIIVDEVTANSIFSREASLSLDVLRDFWTKHQPVSLAVKSGYSADSLSPYKVEIIKRGVFSLPSSSEITDDRAPGGIRHIGKGGQPQLLEDTKRVPAVLSTEFGIVFLLKGDTHGKRIPLRIAYIFPEVGLRSLDTEVIRRSEHTHFYMVGDGHYVGYTLENDWELVPGKWVIQLWFENEMLAEQPFDVFKP